MTFLDRLVQRLNQLLMVVAGAALFGIVLITVGNIWMRLIWAPIKGAVELIGFFGALAAAFALGFSQMKNAHIAVDALTLKFSKKTQNALKILNALIGAVFFSIAGWQLIRWGNTLRRTGELTETLRIIYHPFVYAVAFGCFLIALVLAVQMLQAACPAPKDH
jgi:TRAP-type C4-dicarboxylate transport system permease small subunit